MEPQNNPGTTQVAVELAPRVLEIITTKATHSGVSLDQYLSALAEREAQLMTISHHAGPTLAAMNTPDKRSDEQDAQEHETAEILAQINRAAAETARRLKRVHLAMQDVNNELRALNGKESAAR